VDPLNALLVRDVMSTDVFTVRPDTPTEKVYEMLPEGSQARRQRLYPVLGTDGALLGVLAWSDVLSVHRERPSRPASELIRRPLIARPDETLREAADRMVSSGHGVLPVLDPSAPSQLVGLISQFDLLRAHERVLIEERHRERPLGPRRLNTGLNTLLTARPPAR
jgi:CBS domain-containing protein